MGLTDKGRDWESFFRWIIEILLVLLMTIISAIGAHLWSGLEKNTDAWANLGMNLAVESRARTDLADKVDSLKTDLTTRIAEINSKLDALSVDPQRAQIVQLNQQLAEVSDRMYALQNQLDQAKKESCRHARRVDGSR